MTAQQVAAFKDFTPGSGASGAPAAAAQVEPEEEEEDDAPAESSGGSGSYPPHTVMGLPALSPTMSQGKRSVALLPWCDYLSRLETVEFLMVSFLPCQSCFDPVCLFHRGRSCWLVSKEQCTLTGD